MYKVLSFLKINTINQIWIRPTEWFEYQLPKNSLMNTLRGIGC